MKKAALLSLSYFLVAVQGLISQTNPQGRQENFEYLIQQLFPVQDEDLPYEDLYEALFQYYMQPLDLNRVGQEDLQSLFLLTEQQIQSFFMHLQRNGKLLSIYELQAIPGWDLFTIHRIRPFVTVREAGYRRDNQNLLSRIKESGKAIFLLRTERVAEGRQGYQSRNDTTPPAYLGSPDKVYSRFRISRPHDFSFGITMEKDAGEQIKWKPSAKEYGADFVSYHATLFNQRKLKALTLGDYQLQFGQSLVFGSGFSIGKGAETITTLRRSNTGIRPYTSVLEAGFFRGGAFTYELVPQLNVTLLYSGTPGDAALTFSADSAPAHPASQFSSLQQTGYHRTKNEITSKGNIREQSAGAIVHFKSKDRRWQTGATSLYTHFSHSWKKRPAPYQLFEFSGKENFAGSVFAEYTWENIHLFSEMAMSLRGGTGFVGGSLITLSPEIAFSVHLRSYSPDFHSFYSTGFGEGTRTINEKGVYLGIKYQPSRKWWYSAYFDRFSFPWLRYRVDAPSDGYEYMLRANYQPSKKLLFYTQFREEVKDINLSEGSPIHIPLPGSKINYLLSMDFSVADNLRLQSRVQGSRYFYNGVTTKGFALAQDISWGYKQLRISGRLALFDTDDYQNRQYIYEKDVLWAFSIPAYNGKGIRNYLLLQYKISRQVTVWLRWSRSLYTDRTEISSGNEKIDGSQINQIKTQIRWTFINS